MPDVQHKSIVPANPSGLTDEELISHAGYHLYNNRTLPHAWQLVLLARFTALTAPRNNK